MSDYFAALLRSAGAVPGRASAGAGAPEAAFEQIVEVDAIRSDAATSAIRPPAAAASRPDRPAPSAIDAPDRATAAPVAATAVVRPETQREAAPKPGAPSAADAPLHPLVQAALQWVRADAPAAETPATLPPPERSQPGPAGAEPPLRAAPTASPHDDEMAPASRPIERELATQPVLAISARDDALDVDLPRRATTNSPAAFAPSDQTRAPPSPPRVEVSIGTIHVRVDATPTPRPTTAPPPQIVRPPAPDRPATRSGLSRARLPRF